MCTYMYLLVFAKKNVAVYIIATPLNSQLSAFYAAPNYLSLFSVQININNFSVNFKGDMQLNGVYDLAVELSLRFYVYLSLFSVNLLSGLPIIKRETPIL